MTSLAQTVLDKYNGVTTAPPVTPASKKIHIQVSVISGNIISPLGTFDSKESVKAYLQKGISRVTYTKASGDVDVMECTLDPKFLPTKSTTSSQGQSEQEHLLHVYSPARDGWRSIIVANVQSILKLTS